MLLILLVLYAVYYFYGSSKTTTTKVTPLTSMNFQVILGLEEELREINEIRMRAIRRKQMGDVFLIS